MTYTLDTPNLCHQTLLRLHIGKAIKTHTEDVCQNISSRHPSPPYRWVQLHKALAWRCRRSPRGTAEACRQQVPERFGDTFPMSFRKVCVHPGIPGKPSQPSRCASPSVSLRHSLPAALTVPKSGGVRSTAENKAWTNGQLSQRLKRHGRLSARKLPENMQFVLGDSCWGKNSIVFPLMYFRTDIHVSVRSTISPTAKWRLWSCVRDYIQQR